MAVYIDSAENKFMRMKMCHMLGDSIVELHEMADKIGMKRSWFQPFSFPHYDLSKSKRALAIEQGAVVITRQEHGALMRRLRADPAFMEEWKNNVHSN